MTEKKIVRATQVAFDLAENTQINIRRQALLDNVSPSDYVRKVLGLEMSGKPKRLRLSVSLTSDEITKLADTYGIASDNRVAIKQKAAEILINHAETLDDTPTLLKK